MRLIDADALMKDLEKWMKQVDPTHPQEDNAIPPMEDIIVSTLMTIEEQPTIEERKWTPCNWHKDTENLPDECESVLICIKDKIGTFVDVSYRTDYNRWERYGRNINVVAWMPLPEPYRKDGD